MTKPVTKPTTRRHKTHPNRVPEPAARGTRTTLQGALAAALAVWLNPHLPHLIPHQRAALIVILTALITAAWVAVEDYVGRAFLRQVPPTTAPVIDTKEPA